MSRDVLTDGSTMRIPLLYRGEYSQWVERYRLARSLLIQGLSNDIYSLIDSNKTTKDLWDALARHMLSSEYGSKKKTVVVTSNPLALIAEKTNVRRIKEKVSVSLDSERSEVDDFSELKKITALLAKAFNQRKFYSKPTNNNLRTSSSYQSANKKQEFVKTDTKKVKKKDDEKKKDMSIVKCYNCKKEGHFAKDCKKAKVKYYEYYKTKMMLTKKDKDEQVLLDEDQAWMESSKASSSSADEKIFEIDSLFQQTSSLKPYVLNVILEKIIIDLEDEVVNLLEKEKANLETIESLKSKGFESSETVTFESENQNENDCLVVEKECDKVENSNVIAPGMFKLNVSQCVPPISMSKSSCDSNNVEIKLKRKRRKRKSSKQNVKQKKKGSSNTSNVGLSAVSVSNLNKNVKRYSRKDLLACNNSHLGETRSAFVCNDAMNVSCDSRMNKLLDDNNFFIFDVVNVRISPVSKMPIRKKPRNSMQVRFKSNVIKSLPRTVHKWLPKLQPLAEPIAKWFPRIVQICLWIIDSGCSTHMTSNYVLLTNFVEKFLGTVRFGNNDFAVIAGYGDEIQVAQKKVKIAFENADSSLRVELIPSKIKYAIKINILFPLPINPIQLMNEVLVFKRGSPVQDNVVVLIMIYFILNVGLDDIRLKKTKKRKKSDPNRTKTGS
nr:integrase, catalytic region, zinc finger, CCHC-type, peptidase aspartic, catalytic [Tanacetum cinerariifolium]